MIPFMSFLTILILNAMSKVCQVCAKGPSTGHNVSHSVRRTKRRFLPNLSIKNVYNMLSGKTEKKKLCMKCLKSSGKVRIRAKVPKA